MTQSNQPVNTLAQAEISLKDKVMNNTNNQHSPRMTRVFLSPSDGIKMQSSATPTRQLVFNAAIDKGRMIIQLNTYYNQDGQLMLSSGFNKQNKLNCLYGEITETEDQITINGVQPDVPWDYIEFPKACFMDNKITKSLLIKFPKSYGQVNFKIVDEEFPYLVMWMNKPSEEDPMDATKRGVLIDMVK